MSEFQIDILVQSYLEDLTSQKEIHSHKRLAWKLEALKYGKAEHSEILQEESSHTNPHSGWKQMEGSGAGVGARGLAARSSPDPFWHNSAAAQIIAQQSLHWSDQPVYGC